MMPRTSALVIAALASVLLSSPAAASSSSGHSTSHARSSTHSSSTHSHASTHSSRKAAGVARDSHGRIQRSRAATNSFKHSHPCPSTGKSSGRCPGYTIDHVVPLKRGGSDTPGNMQWQTTAAAKAKDKTE